MARFHSLDDTSEQSMLRRLQRSVSASWRSLSQRELSIEASVVGRGASRSRFVLEDEYDSDADVDACSARLEASDVQEATTGSRMLCDFYNGVVASDQHRCFLDAKGRPVQGAYLEELEILEDYFAGVRHQQAFESDVATKDGHISVDGSFWSVLSNGTTATTSSDTDYWSCLDAAGNKHDMDGDDAASLHVWNRRASWSERRRSWIWGDSGLLGDEPRGVLMPMPLPLSSKEAALPMEGRQTCGKAMSSRRSSLAMDSASRPSVARGSLVPTVAS
ncbi:hypothetical protein PINS_up001278 [Pythium insidiosum]|nr:hypothetical protein PINS_up001278 [Pythium insidiosum]